MPSDSRGNSIDFLLLIEVEPSDLVSKRLGGTSIDMSWKIANPL